MKVSQLNTRDIMNPHVISFLKCPSCPNADLHLTIENLNSTVMEGTLCCQMCGSSYRIVDGVPRLVRQADLVISPTSAFGFQWGRWLTGAFEQEQIYGSDIGKETREFHQYVGLNEQELTGKRILD